MIPIKDLPVVKHRCEWTHADHVWNLPMILSIWSLSAMWPLYHWWGLDQKRADTHLLTFCRGFLPMCDVGCHVVQCRTSTMMSSWRLLILQTANYLFIHLGTVRCDWIYCTTMCFFWIVMMRKLLGNLEARPPPGINILLSLCSFWDFFSEFPSFR